MLQVVPQLLTSARAYDLAVSTTDASSITLSFGQILSARSFEYAISSTSAVAGFGAWTALASTKIIGSLSASTQYWVKVRVVNGVARGPASPIVTGTTASSDAAATTAFLARTSGLDATHTNAYKALINGLVSDGVFTGFDVLCFFATQDSTTAKLDLTTAANNVTLTGTPTFTADKGYSGLAYALATCINSIASNGGTQFTQNSSSIMMWRGSTSSGTEALRMADGNNVTLGISDFGQDDGEIFDTSMLTFGAPLVSGLTSIVRTGAGARNLYHGGSSVANDTRASAASSGTMQFGGQANAVLAMLGVGRGFSGAEMTNINSRANTYLTAVGGA